jgi:phage shock protein A
MIDQNEFLRIELDAIRYCDPIDSANTEIEDLEDLLDDLSRIYADILAKKHSIVGRGESSEPLKADYEHYTMRRKQHDGLIPVFDHF